MNKRTQAFLNLPINEKRIAIAEDVIAQIRQQKFKAERCTFTDIGNIVLPEGDGSSMQNVLLKTQEHCEVCARGAIFLSTIRKSNKCSVKDYLNNEDYNSRNPNKIEKRYFSPETLLSMEKIFEQHFSKFTKTEEKMYNFLVEKYEDSMLSFSFADFTLVGMMRNIIENNGQWKPGKLVKTFPKWIL
jgi:hypothetical protein